MILELNLKRSRRARIWIDELPHAQLSQLESAVSFEASNRSRTPLSCFALELVVPTGGRILYGLAGCRFGSLNDAATQILVRRSALKDEIYLESILVAEYEKITIGLEEEYESALVEGMMSSGDDEGRLPSGKIDIRAGASAMVGSSASMFYDIGKVVGSVYGHAVHPTEEFISELLSPPV